MFIGIRYLRAEAKKQLLCFVKLWLMRFGKNKCAVCALAFLARILMVCTISRIMHNVVVQDFLRWLNTNVNK